MSDVRRMDGCGRRMRALCASLLLLTAPASLQCEFIAVHPPATHHNAADQRTIQRLEDQWHAAVRSNDGAAMASMLADSYIGIGPDGMIVSKNQELADRANGQEHLQRLDVLERRIRIYGTTAVVTSKVDLQGDYSGQPLLGQYRYTRVWSLQHGQWRIVSFEASRIHDASARSR